MPLACRIFVWTALVLITAPAFATESRAQEALDRINLFRAMHGLSPVPIDDALSAACAAHANYLVLNPNISFADPYTEDLALPGATAAGKAVASVSIIEFSAATGANAMTNLFRGYGTRGFLLADDFTKAGYGDATNGGSDFNSAFAVLRTGDIHKPQALFSPPNGSKGIAANVQVVLYGATETSVSELIASSLTANGAPITHGAAVLTTSGSRPDKKHDVVLTPDDDLPAGTVISVVIDYRENGQTKKGEWSFTTSATGVFDPVAAAEGIGSGGGGGGGGTVGTPSDTTDADADGFPANVELAAGTTPTDAASTPFSGQPAGTALTLTLSKAMFKLNFAKPASDSISLSGTLPVPDGFSTLGQQVIVDAGGVARAFGLNEKGSASVPSGATAETRSFKLSKAKSGIAKFTAKLNKGNYAVDLTDNGLTNATTAAASVTVPVTIYFNAAAHTSTFAGTYKAKQGKTGQAK